MRRDYARITEKEAKETTLCYLYKTGIGSKRIGKNQLKEIKSFTVEYFPHYHYTAVCLPEDSEEMQEVLKRKIRERFDDDFDKMLLMRGKIIGS